MLYLVYESFQDQSLAFGSDRSRFVDNQFTGKRAVEDKNVGPTHQDHHDTLYSLYTLYPVCLAFSYTVQIIGKKWTSFLDPLWGIRHWE